MYYILCYYPSPYCGHSEYSSLLVYLFVISEPAHLDAIAVGLQRAWIAFTYNKLLVLKVVYFGSLSNKSEQNLTCSLVG